MTHDEFAASEEAKRFKVVLLELAQALGLPKDHIPGGVTPETTIVEMMEIVDANEYADSFLFTGLAGEVLTRIASLVTAEADARANLKQTEAAIRKLLKDQDVMVRHVREVRERVKRTLALIDSDLDGLSQGLFSTPEEFQARLEKIRSKLVAERDVNDDTLSEPGTLTEV